MKTSVTHASACPLFLESFALAYLKEEEGMFLIVSSSSKSQPNLGARGSTARA
jgi:hypothetical protein